MNYWPGPNSCAVIWNAAPCSKKPCGPWCNARVPGAWQHSAAVNPPWIRFRIARARRDPGRNLHLGGTSAPWPTPSRHPPAGRDGVDPSLGETNDAACEGFLDFTMPGHWLRDPCCWISIPIVLTSMPDQHASSLFDRPDQISSLHGMTNSPILRAPRLCPPERSRQRSFRCSTKSASVSPCVQ